MKRRTKACFMWKYLNKSEMFSLEAKEQGQTGGLLNSNVQGFFWCESGNQILSQNLKDFYSV